MYYSGKWFLLKFKKNNLIKNDILSNLDINVLDNFCLNPILGIASLLGFNPFKNLGTKYASVPLKKSDIPTDKDGPLEPEKVMKASIKKFHNPNSSNVSLAF